MCHSMKSFPPSETSLKTVLPADTRSIITENILTVILYKCVISVSRKMRVVYESCHSKFCLSALMLSIKTYMYIFRKCISELMWMSLGVGVWYTLGRLWERSVWWEKEGKRESTSESLEWNSISVDVYRCLNILF
jgi:hypothetical protein